MKLGGRIPIITLVSFMIVVSVGSAHYSFVEVDLSSTYSFSFKSSNLDLVTWSVVNIPLLGVIDCHSFWGDADIRLCSYCVPDEQVETYSTYFSLSV